jgi:hypothetical protein
MWRDRCRIEKILGIAQNMSLAELEQVIGGLERLREDKIREPYPYSGFEDRTLVLFGCFDLRFRHMEEFERFFGLKMDKFGVLNSVDSYSYLYLTFKTADKLKPILEQRTGKFEGRVLLP